ncbi:MAG: dUTP diphosphatase [Metamycoplasmataceae bacterium]
MNIKDILHKQIELNKAIIESHNPNKEDLEEKQMLALFVEISELANEIQHFKYWKRNIKINDSKIIEEYSDGMHFYLSFGLELNMDVEVTPIIYSDNLTIQFLEIFDSISKFNKEPNLENFDYSFSLFIGLGKLLKYSDENIKAAYLRKNEINLNRIKNKY